jgi:hypothetical protein
VEHNTNGATTTGSYSDTTASGTNPWYYVVEAVLVDGATVVVSDPSPEATATLPNSGGDVSYGTLVGWVGTQSLGLELPVSGDLTQETTAAVRYQINAGGVWYDALPMDRVQSTLIGRVQATNADATRVYVEGQGANAPGSSYIYAGWTMHLLDGSGNIVQSKALSGMVRVSSTVTYMIVESAFSPAPTLNQPYRFQDDRTGAVIYGCNLVNFDPGDDVLVEITLDHPDGIEGTNPIEQTFTLREDDLLGAGSLVTTHYLSESGVDTAARAGTSTGTAWRTPAYAISRWRAAPGDWVVEGENGRYECRNATVTANVEGTLTFKAKYPAIDVGIPTIPNIKGMALTIINEGQHTIFEYGVVTGPTGGDAPLSNVWTLCTLAKRTGPVTGAVTDHVYQYTPGITTSGYDYVGFSTTYDGLAMMIGKSSNDALHPTTRVKATTDAQLIEYMADNDMWNYYWFNSIEQPGTIILRMPPVTGKTTPNDAGTYLHIGKDSAFVSHANGGTAGAVDGSTFRITGCEIRSYLQGLDLKAAARFHAYDHNLFNGMRTGLEINGSKSGGVLNYSEDVLIEYNLFRETGMRAQPGGTASDYINRLWIKNTSTASHNGTPYLEANRDGSVAEGSAIKGQGGCKRLIIRYNEIDGFFNGTGSKGTDYDYRAGGGLEQYGNYIHNIPDDALAEQEPFSFLMRIFDNYVSYAGVFASTVSTEWGPILFLRNYVWKLGDLEIYETPFEKIDPMLFKTGDKNLPAAHVYAVHNTFWSDQPEGKGVHLAGGGSPGRRSEHYWRNNIVRLKWQIIRSGLTGIYGGAAYGLTRIGWDEDYSLFAVEGDYIDPINGGINNGIRLDGVTVSETIAEYRSEANAFTGTSTSGDHSNNFGDTGDPDQPLTDPDWLDALFENVATGDLRLDATTGAAAIGTAYFVPNFSGHLPSGGGGDPVNFGADT